MNTMNISITAIVPVYNVKKYLHQCLDSIAQQTVVFDEVILINDGSTDGGLSICEKYTSKYDYFKLINQENRGLSASRNVGLDHTTSNYVMFLDSDDYLRIDTVMLLKEKLSRFRPDAVYFDSEIQCEDGNIDRKNIYDRNMEEMNGIYMSGWDFFERCYPEKYIVSACMAVYNMKLIRDKEIVFPEGLYYEDNYFSFVFMTNASNVTYIPEKLYQRRYRNNSITISEYSEKKFIDYSKIVLLIWEEIIENKNAVLSEQKRKLLLEFVNDHCDMVLNNYRLCIERNIILGNEAQVCLGSIKKKYRLLLDQYYSADKWNDLILLNKTIRNMKRLVLYYPENKTNMEGLIKTLIKKQQQCYQVLLRDLPLDKEKCKVGIYGMGQHTKGLLAVYEELIGRIICTLVFIDSYIESGMYNGKQVINYKQIDESFDLIIISSFVYQQDMINKVKSIDKKIPIYNFYNSEINADLFSGWDLG